MNQSLYHLSYKSKQAILGGDMVPAASGIRSMSVGQECDVINSRSLWQVYSHPEIPEYCPKGLIESCQDSLVDALGELAGNFKLSVDKVMENFDVWNLKARRIR
jgi:hypothetical protein